MFDHLILFICGTIISFFIGFFIAKLIYHKNGEDHYNSYLKDIEKKGGWDPHKNGEKHTYDPDTSGWI